MIPAEEIAAVLRAAALGELPVKLNDDRSWDQIYCGDLGMWLGTWYVVMFNDCNQLDYVDAATAPDGRVTGYDEWGDDFNPLDMLTLDEQLQLYTAVRAAALKPHP